MQEENRPFGLLPEALVEDLLSRSEEVGQVLLQNIIEVDSKKADFRKQLEENDLLRLFSDLPEVDIPTTCGVDGSYIVDRLMATDLVAAAAVAIEGLTPPVEKKYWEKPQHLPFIDSIKHNSETTKIVQAITWELEIILASKSPHDVIFIDGSITNPFGKLNAALTELKVNTSLDNTNIKDKVISSFPDFINSYHSMVTSTRTDKIWVGVPKYTSLREIGGILEWPDSYDDRAILTSILRPGEFTKPIQRQKPGSSWHINIEGFNFGNEIKQKLDEIIFAINNLQIVYYRPHSHIPAIRLEIAKSNSGNIYQIKRLLHAINFQSKTPGIMEPYPLYIADRIVKSLSSAVPAFRQTITNSMATNYGNDISDIIFHMNSYRTEN